MAAEELNRVNEVGMESRSPPHSGSSNAFPNAVNHPRIPLEITAVDLRLESVITMMMMMIGMLLMKVSQPQRIIIQTCQVIKP